MSKPQPTTVQTEVHRPDSTRFVSDVKPLHNNRYQKKEPWPAFVNTGIVAVNPYLRDSKVPGDHVIVLDERHLLRLMRDYVSYYHHDRIHDSLEKDTANTGRSNRSQPRPQT